MYVFVEVFLWIQQLFRFKLKKINSLFMIKQITILFFILIGFCANAQTINVKGIVKDASNGDPLPGVSITVKGTQQGVQTDFDGYYNFKNIETGTVLVYRYLGYKAVEVLVFKEKVNVALEVESESLNEIVVIGYGTQRKRSLQGQYLW